MDDHITIRLAGPEDAELIGMAGKAVFRNMPDPEHVAGFLGRDEQPMVVAITMGQIIGMAYGTVVLHPDRPRTFQIVDVRVAKLWMRQEIGTRMVRALLTRARKLGCEGIWAATRSGNWPSTQMFRKTGGRQTQGIAAYDWDDFRID